jgi:hypothetical protein
MSAACRACNKDQQHVDGNSVTHFDDHHYRQRVVAWADTVGGVMRSAAVIVSVPAQAVALAALGGALAGPAGLLCGLAAGLLLGAVGGYALSVAAVYPPGRRGLALLLVDHSWSLPNTVAGAVYLLGHLLAGHRVDRPLSRHSGRIAVDGRVWAGYVTTVGQVVAGLRPGSSAALVRHEDLHVLQARLLGPLYLPLVAAHYLLCTLVPVWWLRHDHRARPITGPGGYFSVGVYRHVWHEAWAYRLQDRPPRRPRTETGS